MLMSTQVECGDAPRLEVKAGWLIPFDDKRAGGRLNCVIPLTRAILSAF